jgi:hypothetical protein
MPDREEDDRCDDCRAAGAAMCWHHKPHAHVSPPQQSDDDRCDECRAAGVAVCTHHDAHDHDAHDHDARVHQHDDAPVSQSETSMPPHEHGGHTAIEITVDGRRFPGHINRKGMFHSHELPFMMFPTAEALGRAIANKLDWSEPHGRSKKPETTEQS